MADLAGARAALDRGDWAGALTLLPVAAPGAALVAEEWEARARAAYGAGEFEHAMSAWEALHALQRQQGDDDAAGFTAATVALHLLVDSGLMAAVRGWVSRAEALVGARPDGPAHALLAMVRTYERFLSGDPEGARIHAAQAVDLGSRLGVLPALVLGQVATARLMLHDGDLEAGLAQLDEVALRLTSGEVDPFTTGMMYCELVCAAQNLGLHDRARDWTQMMEQWRHGRAFGGIHGRCRVHRAELLRISGPVSMAEDEALAACAELRPWMRRELGWPLVELGIIRLRRGDLEGAEEAFLEAHDHAWSPQPWLALLRLEQGDLATAGAMVDEAVANPPDLPWKERPPFGDLRMVPLLEAQAEIAAASGDLPGLQSAVAGLAQVAVRVGSGTVPAAAATAAARLALVLGDAAGAVRHASAGVVAWSEAGAPHERAVARVLLGQAHELAGQPHLARLEWQAAHRDFVAFGAERRAAHVAGMFTDDQPRREGAAGPARELPARATMRRTGRVWRVTHGGREVVLADLVGLGHLARMLAEPGREFHVLDLCGAQHSDQGLPVLDDEARDAYRRRLAEVEDDIAEAEDDLDDVRRAHAEQDRDYLVAELGRALGLGGRDRTTHGTSERARTSVTRSLRYALARISEQDAELGAHLGRCVRTGLYCSYQADPMARLVWEVETAP
ncbi:hypothetical protein [Nocardioides allogilvus]|uniref:hypothetical protein n=1 Tax=Nocardioides allogilvus TaxID=2072017 RepID=UPI000D3014CF|nr:hypothetical protein [Nocardioides allogilvus]